MSLKNLLEMINVHVCCDSEVGDCFSEIIILSSKFRNHLIFLLQFFFHALLETLADIFIILFYLKLKQLAAFLRKGTNHNFRLIENSKQLIVHFIDNLRTALLSQVFQLQEQLLFQLTFFLSNLIHYFLDFLLEDLNIVIFTGDSFSDVFQLFLNSLDFGEQLFLYLWDLSGQLVYPIQTLLRVLLQFLLRLRNRLIGFLKYISH